MGDDELTVVEAAAELGVGVHIVYRLLRQGRLQGARTRNWAWRIPRTELERWKLVRAAVQSRPHRGPTHRETRRPQKRWGPLPRYPLA